MKHRHPLCIGARSFHVGNLPLTLENLSKENAMYPSFTGISAWVSSFEATFDHVGRDGDRAPRHQRDLLEANVVRHANLGEQNNAHPLRKAEVGVLEGDSCRHPVRTSSCGPLCLGGNSGLQSTTKPTLGFLPHRQPRTI